VNDSWTGEEPKRKTKIGGVLLKGGIRRAGKKIEGRGGQKKGGGKKTFSHKKRAMEG